jgi:hypothetical protein
MGSGKTFYGVRRMVEAMLRGEYVITNVELNPGWNDAVAKHVGRTASAAKRARVAANLERLYRYEDGLEEAMRYRLPGSGEARGLFLWDEGQNVLNNRNWKDDGRQEILMWATQLRKLGFVGYLLSQHQDNTDAALRRVCNYVIRLQNQREQSRFLGIRTTPWPLFLAVWLPANTPLVSKSKPVKIERYFLSWHRKLYDTHGLFHGLAAYAEANDGLIHLPALAAGGGAARSVAPPDMPATEEA